MNSSAKREWFTAFELEGIGDLPNKATNITRKATKENWKKQQVKGKKGIAYEYHYSSFPSSVQQQLGFDVVEEAFIQKGDDFSYIDDLSIKDNRAINQRFAFRTEWLKKMAIDVAHSTFFKMPDDTMERTIYRGDRALVTIFYHKTNNQLKRGLESLEQLWQLKNGLYVVQVNSRLTIRRLQFDLNKGLYIACDNPLYQSVHLTQEQIDPNMVVGQVRWYAHTVQWD